MHDVNQLLMLFEIVMAHPPFPDHTANIPEVEPAQPELTLATPEPSPLSSNHVFNFLNRNPKEEDPEEEEDLEEEEDPEEEEE
ncbi:hypothetical protein Tco_0557442 [Tanacetum coccineum]